MEIVSRIMYLPSYRDMKVEEVSKRMHSTQQNAPSTQDQSSRKEAL